MNSQTILSSYLTKPRTLSRSHSSWQGFHGQLLIVRRIRSHVWARTLVGLLIWVVFFNSVNYLTHLRHVPGQNQIVANTVSLNQAASLSSNTALINVTQARALPGGPSGELLPPGTLAPDRTYANSYAKGQCTWYVAGRRQIPSDWHNAAAWYYHATASGWSVGTTPAVAAIAWTPAGYYGHVALVEKVSANGSQVYISEMNYRGLYVKSFRWVSSKSFKYIY